MPKQIDAVDTRGQVAIYPPIAQDPQLLQRWAQLVAQAWSDGELKQRLLNEPKAVLREQGIQIPNDVEVRVFEPTDKRIYLSLPPKPAGDEGELTSSQLAGIAGGIPKRPDIP